MRSRPPLWPETDSPPAKMPANTLHHTTELEAVPVVAAKDGTGKFIRDVFFANLPLPFQKVRTYLWLVVFSKAFGPSGFGIWALFQGTLGTALILTSLTQGNAMMRFLSGPRTREEKNSVLSSVLAAVSMSSFCGALLLCAFSQQLSNLLFRDPRGRTVLILTALIVP